MSTTSTSSGPLAYQAIKRRLAREIGAKWRAGSRLPPIAELARGLGTGQRNTHRAVQELVQDGVLISRPGMGTFVRGEFQASQLPDAGAERAFDLEIAQPNARLATKRVVMVRNNLQRDDFQSFIATVIVDRLNGAGVPVTQVSWAEQGGEALPPEVDDADAIVLINPAAAMPIDPKPNQLMSIVGPGLDLGLHATRRTDFISVDQIGGGMLAGQRLRDAGCDDVCYIGVGEQSPHTLDRTSAARLEGFEHGWGQPIKAAHQLLAYAYDVCVGARMVRRYLKLARRPEGVFCASDELALGFVVGGLAAGIEPGTDYKLVGFDGQPMGRQIGEGPLTTVEVPLEEMGRKAADLLVNRFDDPDQPVRRLALGCRLFEGQTVEASRMRIKSRRIYKADQI